MACSKGRFKFSVMVGMLMLIVGLQQEVAAEGISPFFRRLLQQEREERMIGEVQREEAEGRQLRGGGRGWEGSPPPPPPANNRPPPPPPPAANNRPPPPRGGGGWGGSSPPPPPHVNSPPPPLITPPPPPSSGTCESTCGKVSPYDSFTKPCCCSNKCVDLNVNQYSCGSCGNACAGGLSCCKGTCRNLNTDSNNCGKCGNKCHYGDKCNLGMCGYGD